MRRFFGHLKNIFVHKYWVYYFGRRIGLPWLRCVLHDMSKFSTIEFWESVKFYQGTSSPIPACKAANGYSKAWQHHKGRNPHHYEYWTDNYDSGTTTIKMPYDYVMEMIADWCAAGKTYKGIDWSFESQCDWWNSKKASTISIHPETIALQYDWWNSKKASTISIHPETIALLDKFFDKNTNDDLTTILNDWKLNYYIYKEDYNNEL